jgi:hypothetical protein
VYFVHPELIGQLRHALHLAATPSELVAEFDIGETSFCFEFEEPPKAKEKKVAKR